MNQEPVDFIKINAIASATIQIVSSYHTTTYTGTREPFQMVLNVALNKHSANTDQCEFPLYIPAENNYKQEQHLKMLELFQSGVPWVPIECQHFKIYRHQSRGRYRYFAYADSFKVVDYSKVLED